MGCDTNPTVPLTRVQANATYTLPQVETKARVSQVAQVPTTVAAELPLQNNFESQLHDVNEYVALKHAPPRVLVVDLEKHDKISQFSDIDSSPKGYGKNACALIAAAAALGGKDWSPLVKQIAEAAGDDYSHDTGIQPSKYVTALQKVFGAESVVETNDSTLRALYQQLAEGKVVIVDLKVSASTARPSVKAPNFAHFARVLGMDLERGEIYLENTLSGKAYWTLALDEFMDVWEEPETDVSMIPDPANAERVTRWMVILDDAFAVG